jgi:hypothetical protein
MLSHIAALVVKDDRLWLREASYSLLSFSQDSLNSLLICCMYGRLLILGRIALNQEIQLASNTKLTFDEKWEFCAKPIFAALNLGYSSQW